MNIEKRTESLRIIRKQKKVPGVLFGKTIKPVSIQMDEMELTEMYRLNGLTKTFTVKLGKASHLVYIKNLQKDIVNRSHILNVELLKVGKSDIIYGKVPIHIIGKEVIEHAGYLVKVIEDEIKVEYEADQAITKIDIDISNMKVTEMFHIKDVKFPQGIKVDDDLEKVLVHITEQRVVEETPVAVEEKTELPLVEEPKAGTKDDNKK
ncbi:MAG: 50S ribosomal protein L25 [Candidatus Izemoplasmatales bacterium]|jgi:large subunit ribosomal protein L25|nr:50S ribosomal protein L25 [Candidatus Izemoplasmatales bacterium]MDD3865943.1 50S ribosomal protein L25 [Candidatus Izemoplasmatales bacterium]